MHAKQIQSLQNNLKTIITVLWVTKSPPPTKKNKGQTKIQQQKIK